MWNKNEDASNSRSLHSLSSNRSWRDSSASCDDGSKTQITTMIREEEIKSIIEQNLMLNGGKTLIILTLEIGVCMLSTVTKSNEINNLGNQSGLFSNPHQEGVKPDTEKLYKGILKRFSKGFFLTDTRRECNEPIFLSAMLEKSQSREICDLLWNF